MFMNNVIILILAVRICEDTLLYIHDNDVTCLCKVVHSRTGMFLFAAAEEQGRAAFKGIYKLQCRTDAGGCGENLQALLGVEVKSL